MSKSYKTNSCKKSFKPLQELNLIDSFLFGASTEKIQDAEFIAKLIIERATNEKVDQNYGYFRKGIIRYRYLPSWNPYGFICGIL